jgi:hypothetical protein
MRFRNVNERIESGEKSEGMAARVSRVRHMTDIPGSFNITSCLRVRRQQRRGQTARGGTIFTLTKWYLDGVDDTGRVVIAYWVNLAVGDVRVTWHALSEYEAGTPDRRVWSLAATAPPRRTDGELTWCSNALGVKLAMECRDSPHELTLLDAPAHAVQWRGETMASRMRLEQNGRSPFNGVGYAECLTLTVAPWRLPIETVEWGHWISSDLAHASTWFRWHGAHPLDCVVEDGRDAVALRDRALVTTETATLEIAPARMLERRHLREIVYPIPLLARVVPDSLLALEETKWLGRGTRRDADGSVHDGWTVFETVHFRSPAVERDR